MPALSKKTDRKAIESIKKASGLDVNEKKIKRKVEKDKLNKVGVHVVWCVDLDWGRDAEVCGGRTTLCNITNA
jgi:hypothetical protein